MMGDLLRLPLESPSRDAIAMNGGKPLRAIPLSEVRRERTDTLFNEGRIPLGEVTELNGFEGEGKGLTSVLIAARLSREQKSTLFLSGEDSPQATLRPRLEAAGADLAYTNVLPMDAVLELPDDGRKLLAVAAEVEAALVVIDPLVSFLAARVNSWNDHHVRLALAPLRTVADELRCAVLLIRHLNKGASEHVRDRVSGSIAFRAFVRSALLLGRDPEEGESGRRRILVHSKCSFAETAPSQIFEIEPIRIEASGEHDAVDTARLRLVGASEVSAGELLQRLGIDERADRRDVDTWNLEALSGGEWVDTTALNERGLEAGFSVDQLKKSRTRLKRKGRLDSTYTGQPGEAGKHQWKLLEAVAA